MVLQRFALAALLGILILALAACNPGLTVPPAPTLPVSPLPTQAPLPTAAANTPGVLESPLPVPVTPDAGTASATGRLINASTSEPLTNQSLSLGAIICPPDVAEEDKRDLCVYAIDAAFDPSTLTDNAGRFTFASIKAGEYVMVVGNPEAKHTILANSANQPLIWKVEADKVTDFGDLEVDLR
ncbi:MAG: hypothetical protein MUC34_01755 [Anaerolineae bacterium]|jgi:hypothetical protein|nr:hypothetical protein [Anaerolineae bacterium]